jgi:hypothetical protein
VIWPSPATERAIFLCDASQVIDLIAGIKRLTPRGVSPILFIFHSCALMNFRLILSFETTLKVTGGRGEIARRIEQHRI